MGVIGLYYGHFSRISLWKSRPEPPKSRGMAPYGIREPKSTVKSTKWSPVTKESEGGPGMLSKGEPITIHRNAFQRTHPASRSKIKFTMMSGELGPTGSGSERRKTWLRCNVFYTVIGEPEMGKWRINNHPSVLIGR